ncbi:MAG: hypothetical protein HKN40_00795 [Winogradskyella sp.]|uniref:hypothetical protein n=1 Tax=Winogradskyella sp. TaxID=1883156 RepID=UPI00179EE040|nr:hypothetical protein [Winogradskyella sp.]
MMKRTSTILLLLLTTLIYGQNSTLFQNINFRAAELKHQLNTSGDSLLLHGERRIEKVVIFNSDFEKTFEVKDHSSKIPLIDIPVGRYVAEVKVADKLIILTLLRHEDLKDILPQNKVVEQSHEELEETVINNTVNTGISFQENQRVSPANAKLKEPEEKIITGYWIIHEISNGHRSRKITRMGDKEVVDLMIAKNELDLRTKAGKFNTLTIWEVYDTGKFFRFKRLNANYAEETESDFFNVNPIYTTPKNKNLEKTKV